MSMPKLPLTSMGQSFDILEYGASLPGSLADLIMQIRTFNFEGVEYSPFIVGFGGVHPLYTTFSNLRATVVALSQQATPVEARVIYYVMFSS